MRWQVVITEAETQPGSWLTASGLVKRNPESLNDQIIGTRVLCHQQDIDTATPGQLPGTNMRRINHRHQPPRYLWFQTSTTKYWPEPDLLCMVIFLPKVVQLQVSFNHSSTSAPCKHLMSSQRTSFIHFMVPRMQRYLPNFLRNINTKVWLSQSKSWKLNKVLLTFYVKVINNTKKKNEMIPDYKLL